MRFDSLQAWLNWQESLHPRSIDLGLDRVAQVFKKLNPQQKKPVTITVAGTNGKGSCVALLETIYRTQGYKVGTYTSPHLLKYNERIKLDATPVSDVLICEAFARIDDTRADISLSYFEFGTLAALDIFIRAGVDIQLLEVGLGGRLDAVNIVDADAAIISSIDIDHVDWLGETREAIGREKAGVFRPFTPAIVSDENPPIALQEVAMQKQSLLFKIGHDFNYQKSEHSWDWYSGKESYTQLPFPNLKGEHQFRNASAVILAVSKLQSVLPISENAIRTALTNVQLLGRFQLIQTEIPVLLDVAHNPQAVKTLLDYLLDNFADKKIYAVFAMMKDKDIGAVIDIIRAKITHWFVAPLSNPRAATIKTLKTVFAEKQLQNVSFDFVNFNQAFSCAQASANKDDLILIFGSFFLVSEYLAEFGNQ